MITRPSVTSQVVVLLVDDDMIFAQALHRFFAQDRDIAFHYCASPHEALEQAEVLRPTVILQNVEKYPMCTGSNSSVNTARRPLPPRSPLSFCAARKTRLARAKPSRKEPTITSSSYRIVSSWWLASVIIPECIQVPITPVRYP
jgi:hypothetical protein